MKKNIKTIIIILIIIALLIIGSKYYSKISKESLDNNSNIEVNIEDSTAHTDDNINTEINTKDSTAYTHNDSDIVINIEVTKVNEKLTINKYFENSYTVDW